MPDIDFVMTYPCYFLLTAEGNLTTIIIDSNTCLCLFTDNDILKTFYREKFGSSTEDREISVVECLGYDGLIETLKEHEAELALHNVFHLAIDPTLGKMVGYVLIREFIEQLVR